MTCPQFRSLLPLCDNSASLTAQCAAHLAECPVCLDAVIQDGWPAALGQFTKGEDDENARQ